MGCRNHGNRAGFVRPILPGLVLVDKTVHERGAFFSRAFWRALLGIWRAPSITYSSLDADAGRRVLPPQPW